MAYLAAKTTRINLGAAVMTLPLYDPIRVVENISFVDILSNGRVRLGARLGLPAVRVRGLRARFRAPPRHRQEEAIGLMFELPAQRHRCGPQGHVLQRHGVEGEYEMLPHHEQMPHPPLYMAGGTDRSIGYAARNGFGLMLSTLPWLETLAAQTALYKRELARRAPSAADQNPAAGKIDIARWVYIADTDAAAAPTPRRRSSGTSAISGRGHRGYLGTVSEKSSARAQLRRPARHHAAARLGRATVIARLREMQARTGMTSLLLHYPPYYGHEKAMQSLRLFAEKVIPDFRPPVERTAVA